MASNHLDLSSEELAHARLLSVSALLEDLQVAESRLEHLRGILSAAEDGNLDSVDSTTDLKRSLATAESEIAARRVATSETIRAVAAMGETHGLPTVDLEPGDSEAIQDKLIARLREFSRSGTRKDLFPVVLESYVSTNRPRELSWTSGKNSAFAPGTAALLDMSLLDAQEDLAEMGRRHKRAVKRISRDSMAPGAQIGMSAVSLAFGLSLPGATAVGEFVGEAFFDLHGAAAVSAGLAALGGGSIASGGLGMAVGTWVAALAMKGVSVAQSKIVLTRALARHSSATIIQELATMDVLAEQDPELRPTIEGRLREIATQLRADWESVRPNPAMRRNRIWNRVKTLAEDPGSFSNVVQEIGQDLPSAVEKSMATSVRAAEAQLRHIESEPWKRNLTSIPRFFGVPMAGRLIDEAEAKFSQWGVTEQVEKGFAEYAEKKGVDSSPERLNEPPRYYTREDLR